MTQYTFGGVPADVLTTSGGTVVADYPITVRVAGTGATVTAMYESDGTTPIAQLRSNPSGSDTPGAIRTFKVDGVTAIEYEYNGPSGSPVRWYEAAREAATGALDQIEDKLDLSGGTLTGAVHAALGASTAEAFSTAVTGDSNERWRITADGKQSWGPGNAALDTFLQRSAAGVLETPGTLLAGQVSLAGAQIYNPVLYGAPNNGTGNASTGIQAALNAARDAGGGWVMVQPGTYLIGATLRIYANTRLTLLPGAEFRRNVAATMLLNGDAAQNLAGYTGNGNIVLEGGVWNMRGTTAGLTASAMCISIGHARGITIRDIEIRDLPGYHGIELNSTKDGKVLDCSFRGYVDPGGRTFSEAIQLDLAKGSAYFGGFGPYDHTPCEDIEIRGCYVGASGTAGTVAWPRGIGSHSATIGRWHKRIRIADNTFEGLAQYGVSIYSWSDVTVTGNTMSGCGAGVRAQVVDSTDTNDTKNTSGTQTSASQDLRNVTIVGNTITGGIGYDDAILLSGEATGKVLNVSIGDNVIETTTNSENGVRCSYAEQYTVTGNTIRGVSGTGISQQNIAGGNVTGNRIYQPGSSGISCDTGTGVTIASNSVREAGVNGLHVLGGADIQATGNYLKGSSRAASGSYGIRVSSSTDGLLIAGNRVRKYGSGNEAAYGLSITSTCTNVRRYGNDLTDSGTSGMLDDQTTGAETTAFDVTGNLEDLMRPAGRYETASRLRAGATSTAAVSGTLYLVPIWLPKGFTVSNISFMNGATAAGTPTNWWFSLHNSARVALARTADQTTAAWAANTVKTLAVAQATAGSASTYVTTYAGLHYLGFMMKATTLPNLVGEGSMATGAAASPGFGDTNTGMTTPPTVTGGAFTANAFGGNVGLLAYGYVA
ncbi:right-handed parallel beta-helix repeat-containing protein [Streptomyces angustmyceticus]|uniref:right-handed parallel beta-helix repeat-containing protein n=1 Tax=Streptomyces angustmyceticus TaxID=285578 RepID=UPI00344B4D1B